MSHLNSDRRYLHTSEYEWLLIAQQGILKKVWYDSPEDAERHFSREECLYSFDVSNNHQNYWDGVRQFLEWLGSEIKYGSQWAHISYKTLREANYISKRKDWTDVLPKEIVDWAVSKINAHIKSNKSEFADNYRAAQINKSSQVRRYKKQVKHGCCGFDDWKEVGPDGNEYLLGYNSGH